VDALQLIRQSLYSDDVGLQAQRVQEAREESPANYLAQEYLEASMAADVPSFPLSDPFTQAYNYTDTVYLAIQHLMQAMSAATIGLEQKVNSKGASAQSGAQFTDQGYEPLFDHPLHDVLNNPNPADTFFEFLCQCILNWNLHGRILIWGRPNAVGAPKRLYCLPVPLCVPAFSIGTPQYPLGAWRIQQFYPTTGISGILPTGLTGMSGAYIDAREVYDMKNPHPIYRWAPYSHLFGGQVPIDLIHNIHLSFWSIMSQGPKPAGFIDAPGAGDNEIKAIQNKIDNAAGGPRKHGRPIVLGGGDPDRPALKWNTVGALVPDALHGEGWEIFTSFVLAIFGLDMAAVGLRRSGGYAERWAAKRDERDTLVTFLSQLASVLTKGAVKQWGLAKKGVRCVINLPEMTGYEPSEMSRDMAGDGSGSYNEVRRLRGLKGANGVMEKEHDGVKIGDYPYPIAMKLAEKALGIDDVAEQETLAKTDATLQQQTGAQPQSTEETRNNPENNRPSPSQEEKGAAGSLGGKGSAGEKPGIETKSLPNRIDPGVHNRLRLKNIVDRVLSAPVLCNGVSHDEDRERPSVA